MFTDQERRITDRLLTTTRAARKRLDFDRPVERALLRECLEIAIQAPTGSNTQNWRWVIVTDPAQRRSLADLYAGAMAAGGESVQKYMEATAANRALVDPAQTERVMGSAMYLIEHLARVPAMVIPCIAGASGLRDAFNDSTLFGSIYPAIWNFQLAAYSRGLGTVLTTAHLLREAEAATVLNLPPDVKQIALIPVAYVKGEPFKRAARRPVDEILHWDRWQ
ncbi:MAG: nitroreductase family protein [Gammaproteobacteria bacterium]